MDKAKTAENDNEERQSRPSRSARKRASTALQKLGEELAELTQPQREDMKLPQELMDALAMLDRTTDHEGARRQRQYIGRLMRELAEMDLEAITAALAQRRCRQRG